MGYKLESLFWRFMVGKWSPLHRLRLLWLDAQIARQLLILFVRSL